jgi:hypothetical protein
LEIYVTIVAEKRGIAKRQKRRSANINITITITMKSRTKTRKMKAIKEDSLPSKPDKLSLYPMEKPHSNQSNTGATWLVSNQSIDRSINRSRPIPATEEYRNAEWSPGNPFVKSRRRLGASQDIKSCSEKEIQNFLPHALDHWTGSGLNLLMQQEIVRTIERKKKKLTW